jgi:pimeloyl-ACP methyl ester carboxylesterase
LKASTLRDESRARGLAETANILVDPTYRNQSITAPGRFVTTDVVVSRDGVAIAYRQIGRGPGLVLLHGAMESAVSHMGLAEALADEFTVYLPERRGHTLGVPFDETYCMQHEVDDVEALLTHTGATAIFGVSAGGLVALEAALTLPNIQRVAVYEPALIVDGAPPAALFARCDSEIIEGRTAAALITGMKAAQLGPPFLDAMPRWLLEFATNRAMASQDRKAERGDATMRMLAPTLHYDFRLIAEMAGMLERFAAIRCDALLLGGSKSPRWLRSALDALASILPHARRIEFAGLDHGGSSDDGATNRGGQPQRVAEEMRKCFLRRQARPTYNP